MSRIFKKKEVNNNTCKKSSIFPAHPSDTSSEVHPTMSDLELQSLAKKVGAAKCVIFVGCYSANATSNFDNVSSAHRVCVASYHCRGEHRARL